MIMRRKHVSRVQAITLVPTYVIYLLVSRLYRKHPWHRTTYSYDDWCQGATGTCQMYGILISLALWQAGVVLLILSHHGF